MRAHRPIVLALGIAACGPGDARDASSGIDAVGTDVASTVDSATSIDASRDDAGPDHDAPSARPDGFAWDFEHATPGTPSAPGASIADATTAGLDGIADGTLAYVAGELVHDVAARPAFGKAITLDATRSAAVADVAAGESFRIEAGFRTEAHGQGGEAGSGALLARESDGQAGFRLAVEDGVVTFRVGSRGAAPSVVRSARIVSDDRWHRVTAVRDAMASRLVLVVDGTEVVRATDASTDLASTAPITALRAGATAHPFDGLLDTVRFVRARIEVPTAAPERTVTPVFRAGSEPVPGHTTHSYAAFRLPAIVRTARGTLLAFAEGRVDDPCDFGDIDVVMKRSTDNGATWSSLVRVVDADGNKAGNPNPVVTRTGVALLTTIDRVNATCDGAGSQRFEALTSSDDGLTWSAPRDVTSGVHLSAWAGMLLGPGHATRLAHGPHAGALVVSGNHHRATDGHAGGQTLLSEDDGVSWRVGVSEDTSSEHVNESATAELLDGSLLVNTRDQLAAPPATAEHTHGLRALAHVTPALAYTAAPAFVRTSTFRGPTVEGSLLGRDGSERFGDEARVFFGLPAGEHGSPAGVRHDLRVYPSHDQGRSWEAGHRVVGPWAAYSDLVALGDATLGVLYETGIAPGSSFVPYQRLDFARLGVEALDERTLLSFTFEERAPGDAFGTMAGAGVAPMPLRETGGVTLVAGRRASTAARFDGSARACTTAAAVAGWLDFDRRDSFAIEATFRTTAHGGTAAEDTGTLVSRSDVSSAPAWWLRVEGGRLRFLVASCDAGSEQTVNCGVFPGTCAGIGPCSTDSVTSAVTVNDGAWHHVRAVRDAVAGQLRVEVDDAPAVHVASPAGGLVTNEEPLCIGAFDDGSRAFRGDLDGVRIELVN